jgi:hypothetical protein
VLSVAAVLLFASGCAAPGRVETEAVPTADFTSRHTFAWQESQASYDPEPSAQDEQQVKEVKDAIQTAVLQQLASKGFKPSGENPDFLVSFHLVVKVTKAPDLCMRRNLIFHWPGPLDDDTYDVCQRDTVMPNRTVRKGTLVVFVVDTATRNLLWQGVADDAAAVSRKDQLTKLRVAVEQMFASFPRETA